MTRKNPVGGLLRDNPVAVTLVGLCPAAAVTGRVIDALWMSLGLIFVLLLTRASREILHILQDNPEDGLPLSAPRPPKAQGLLGPQWLGFLFLASCFTASFELILRAFVPQESASLGIYIPLVAVNCIVLERVADPDAGRRSQKHGSRIFRALWKAGVSGAGFAISLIVISLVRETLGSGTITLFPVGNFSGTLVVAGIAAAPARALIYAGGGLLCLGYLAGAVRLAGRLRRRKARDGAEAASA
jgi:H+/Na+-translocating ferredoxin:NAD+ oxidoreductase subunit E